MMMMMMMMIIIIIIIDSGWSYFKWSNLKHSQSTNKSQVLQILFLWWGERGEGGVLSPTTLKDFYEAFKSFLPRQEVNIWTTFWFISRGGSGPQKNYLDKHPKSKNVCGFSFSVQRNLRKKYLNFHDKILQLKCVNHKNSIIFHKKRA